MRTGIALVTLLSLATVSAGEARSPFVVHEWGTYTTFQDSRGTTLEGLQHETERLPDFVYSRTESRPSPFAGLGDTSFDEVVPAAPRSRLTVHVELPAATPAVTAAPREAAPVATVPMVTTVATPAAPAACEWIRTGRCGDGYRSCTLATHDHAGEPNCVGSGCAHIGGCKDRIRGTSSCEQMTVTQGRDGIDVEVTAERMRRVRGKMETPVIYFYSDEEKRVRVRVDFTGGLLTQWYPRESRAVPAFVATERTTDLSAVTGSTLEWDLELVPASRSLPKMPAVAKDDPWQYAREVRSAGVRTAGRTAGEEERYVFYRGLGNTKPALVVTALGRGVAVARNTEAHTIPAAFAVEMTPQGGRFVSLGALPAGEAREYDLSRVAFLPKADAVAALDAAAHAALVAQGLYADEASAMVRTWSATWFGAEGTRIVHLLPRPAIDAMIPLAIEPSPDETIRVMVGRVEYLTPESEAALAQNLAGFARGDATALRALVRRGRFLEAATRAVSSSATDPAVRIGAATVLQAYESEQLGQPKPGSTKD